MKFIQTGSSVPFAERYFEDYWEGEIVEFGQYSMSEAEIIAFASQYDPQVFHLDKEAAKISSFGTLVASGWHTVGVTMRLLVLHFISPLSSMGSPGVDQIRWHKPVKPGDVLSLRLHITKTKRSSSKPDRGIVWFQTTTLNQQAEALMTMEGMGMYRCRSVPTT